MLRFSILGRLGLIAAMSATAAWLPGPALAASEPTIATIAGGVGGPELHHRREWHVRVHR